MRQTNPHTYYLRTAIEAATPVRRVVMLFDGAIRFLSQAVTAMAVKDYEAQSHNINCAQNIVAHLQCSLDRDVAGKLADTLDAFYVPLYDQLTAANIFDDLVKVENAIEVLREMRETWVEVDRQCQADKSAGNARGELIAA